MKIASFLFVVYRYDNSTGTFTVPSGGDGFYYFSVYFIVRQFEHAGFAIEINEEFICTAWADRDNSIYADPGPTSCLGLLLLLQVK